MSFPKIVCIISFCFSVSACSLFGPEPEKPDIPEKVLYQTAIDSLQNNEYDVAIDSLELLEARYPFGEYSQQAQLELIYAYYKHDEPDAAIISADRFIRLNPVHENVDYAYYLKGLAALEQTKGWLDSYLPIDQNQRDPGAALESFDAFSNLVGRYPNSMYADDANKRMIFLKNRLATQEIQIAEFYMEREAYIAAANRARYVIENFQESLATGRALEIMYQAYSQLKLDDLANDAKTVLNQNFPNYSLTQYQHTTDNLLSTVTFGLFGKTSVRPPLWTPDISKDADTSAQLPDAVIDESKSEQRSWLNKATFGLFD